MLAKSVRRKIIGGAKAVARKPIQAGLSKTELASRSRVKSAAGRTKRVWIVSRYAKQRDSVAQALGEQLQLPVKRIDVSKTVGKYIGETEKNLSEIFGKAEDRDWVLFFDEADALFGKRTDEMDAYDRYANPAVSYFLKQLERSKRPVVVATRRKQDLDPAIVRRLRMSVVTPLPLPKVRVKLRPSPFACPT